MSSALLHLLVTAQDPPSVSTELIGAFLRARGINLPENPAPLPGAPGKFHVSFVPPANIDLFMKFIAKPRALANGALVSFEVSDVAPETSAPAKPVLDPRVEQFKEALQTDDAAAVEVLIEDGLDPNAQFGLKTCLLHATIVAKQLNITRTLLAHGADPNLPAPESGRVPLIYAIGNNLPEIVQVLVEAGADPRAKTPNGQPLDTPMNKEIRALLLAKLGITESMPETGAAELKDTGSREVKLLDQFKVALQNNKTGKAIGLIEAGLDPNAQFGPKSCLIHAAIQKHNVKVVRALIAHGADPNLPAPQTERTPLMAAVITDLAEIVQVLLDAGADPRIKTPDGTPMSRATPEIRALMQSKTAVASKSSLLKQFKVALQTDDVAAVQKLIQGGLDPNAQYSTKMSLIHAAVQENKLSTAHVLLANGADPNKPAPESGRTPLLMATQTKSSEMVQVLLDAGANPRVKTPFGTPLSKATNEEIRLMMLAKLPIDPASDELAAAIIAHDAGKVAQMLGDSVHANTLIQFNLRPLHLAIFVGSLEIVNLLIRAGADVNMKTKQTCVSPMAVALQCGSPDIQLSLAMAGAVA